MKPKPKPKHGPEFPQSFLPPHIERAADEAMSEVIAEDAMIATLLKARPAA